MKRHRVHPVRRLLTLLLAIGLALGGVAPVSAQPDAPSAVMSPAALYVGHPVPQLLTLTGTATSFEQGVTEVAILRSAGDEESFWFDEVENALGPVSVSGTTGLSVQLLTSLPEGEYVFRITGPVDLDIYFEVLWPRAEVEPFILDVGYDAPRLMHVRGYGTDFLAGTPAVTVFSVDFSDGQVLTELDDAVGEVLVHGPDSLSFELRPSLPIGEYVARVTIADETFDAWFRVEPTDVLAWVSPVRLEVGFELPSTMTVQGTRTSFAAGVTTVEVLREVWEDDGSRFVEVPGVVGAVEVQSETELMFELVGELELGSYLARIVTGDEIVLADFRVAGPPTAWVVPAWLETEHPVPLEMSVHGDGISFEDDTTVRLLRELADEDGRGSVEIDGAIENLEVQEPGWLTFEIVVPLEPGTYELRIQTGDQVVWPTFVVVAPGDPTAYVDPWLLPEGYAVPRSLTVTGEGTHFQVGVTTLSLEAGRWDEDGHGWVWDEAPPAIGAVEVLGPTELTIELDLSLPVGYYQLTITTADEIVRTTLVVEATPPAARVAVDPSRLTAGYDVPQPMTVIGWSTSFTDDDPSVEVLRWDWDETADAYLWVPIPGAVGQVEVLGPGELTFELALQLAEDGYLIRVRSGRWTLEARFEVSSTPPSPVAWVDPTILDVGYAVPLSMWVWGTDTTFTGGLTEVTVLGSVYVDGDWQAIELADVVGDVEVRSRTRLSFELVGQLDAGFYNVRVTTDDEVALAWFVVVGPPEPQIVSVDPPHLTTGYEPPIPFTVLALGTAFEEDVTQVALLGWEEDAEGGDYRPIAGALQGIEVVSPTELRFDLVAALHVGWYLLEIVTGEQMLRWDFGVFHPWDPTPRLSIYPYSLIAGYAVPVEVEVHGTNTSFEDGETGVSILREVEGNLGGGMWEPIWGATGPAEVGDTGYLRFELRAQLEAGTYRVRVSTDEEVLEAPLVVEAVLDPVVVTKTAAAATTLAGGRNGYTITVTNPNDEAVPLDAIIDTLPEGFRYVEGSTTGATTLEPISNEPELVWAAPFSVPAKGTLSLTFEVTVSEVPGTYDNVADAVTPHRRFPVQGSGPTATVTVDPDGPPPPPTTCVDLVASEVVGQVCVEVGEDAIVVTTTATGPWSLREIAVAVADDLEGFPLTARGAKAGQPVVKSFPYHSKYPSGTETVHTEIPIGTVTVDDGFLVALNAVVERPDGRGKKSITESAWAAGAHYVAGDLATYLEVPAR